MSFPRGYFDSDFSGAKIAAGRWGRAAFEPEQVVMSTWSYPRPKGTGRVGCDPLQRGRRPRQRRSASRWLDYGLDSATDGSEGSLPHALEEGLYARSASIISRQFPLATSQIRIPPCRQLASRLPFGSHATSLTGLLSSPGHVSRSPRTRKAIRKAIRSDRWKGSMGSFRP
jgi:hypothetical protein